MLRLICQAKSLSPVPAHHVVAALTLKRSSSWPIVRAKIHSQASQTGSPLPRYLAILSSASRHSLFASFRERPIAINCFTNVPRFIPSILLCGLSVRPSRYPYLFSAGIADSVVFPFAVSMTALSAHRHCGHFLSAVRAVVRDISRICPLTTPVSCKRHPHSATAALWGVVLIYDPSCHFNPFHIRRRRVPCAVPGCSARSLVCRFAHKSCRLCVWYRQERRCQPPTKRLCWAVNSWYASSCRLKYTGSISYPIKSSPAS